MRFVDFVKKCVCVFTALAVGFAQPAIAIAVGASASANATYFVWDDVRSKDKCVSVTDATQDATASNQASPTTGTDDGGGDREITNPNSNEHKWAQVIFDQLTKDWGISAIVAHNARFDYNALNNTKRYITTSRSRFFFPFGAKFVDTLKLSRNVFANDDDYREFCVSNEYVTKRNENRYTAEVIYRFLTGDNDFEEEHTGLADCMIEKEILRHCLVTESAESGYLW